MLTTPVKPKQHYSETLRLKGNTCPQGACLLYNLGESSLQTRQKVAKRWTFVKSSGAKLLFLRNCQFHKQDHKGTTEQSSVSRARVGGAVLAFGLQLKVPVLESFTPSLLPELLALGS